MKGKSFINVGAEIAVQRNTDDDDDDDPLLFQTKVFKKPSFSRDCTGTATVAGEGEAFCRLDSLLSFPRVIS